MARDLSRSRELNKDRQHKRRWQVMVRVVIQRHLKEGKKADLMPLLRELRAAAMSRSGYITGETLGSPGDPSAISVLSTWRSLEDWKAWEKSEPRVRLYKKVEMLLVEKPKISVYQVLATERK
jgi:heme-degrading monooxygenase HmoA